MSNVDLNKLSEKLTKQKPVGVSPIGKLTPHNPKNDGTRESANGDSTLEPRRFGN